MRSIFKIAISLLLAAALLAGFTSCQKIKEAFDSGETGTTAASENKGSDPAIPVSLTRKAGKFTFLLINEGQREGELASMFVVALDVTDDSSASFLQIPARTYISGGSLASIYSSSFSAAVSDGTNPGIAREKAVAALRSALSSKMCIRVDYYICFTPEGLAGAIDSLAGITVDVPFVIPGPNNGSITAGRRELTGAEVTYYASYSGYSPASALDAYKIIYAAAISKAREIISSSNLALFVLELRNSCMTDVPFNAGEDIFYMRKLLSSDSADIRFTSLATQTYAISTGLSEIVYKAAVCSQIQDFLDIYSAGNVADEFDINEDMNDKSNSMINTIYRLQGSIPAVFDLTAVSGGAIKLGR